MKIDREKNAKTHDIRKGRFDTVQSEAPQTVS